MPLRRQPEESPEQARRQLVGQQPLTGRSRAGSGLPSKCLPQVPSSPLPARSQPAAAVGVGPPRTGRLQRLPGSLLVCSHRPANLDTHTKQFPIEHLSRTPRTIRRWVGCWNAGRGLYSHVRSYWWLQPCSERQRENGNRRGRNRIPCIGLSGSRNECDTHDSDPARCQRFPRQCDLSGYTSPSGCLYIYIYIHTHKLKY